MSIPITLSTPWTKVRAQPQPVGASVVSTIGLTTALYRRVLFNGSFFLTVGVSRRTADGVNSLMAAKSVDGTTWAKTLMEYPKFFTDGIQNPGLLYGQWYESTPGLFLLQDGSFLLLCSTGASYSTDGENWTDPDASGLFTRSLIDAGRFTSSASMAYRMPLTDQAADVLVGFFPEAGDTTQVRGFRTKYPSGVYGARNWETLQLSGIALGNYTRIKYVKWCYSSFFCIGVAGSTGKQFVARSGNGLTWTTPTIPNNFIPQAIAEKRGTICMVGEATGAGTKCAATSTDSGNSWTLGALPKPSEVNGPWSDITADSLRFFTASIGEYAFSSNGINWAVQKNADLYSLPSQVAAGNDCFVVTLGNNKIVRIKI